MFSFSISLQKSCVHFLFIVSMSSQNAISFILYTSFSCLISAMTFSTLLCRKRPFASKQNVHVNGHPLEVTIWNVLGSFLYVLGRELYFDMSSRCLAGKGRESRFLTFPAFTTFNCLYFSMSLTISIIMLSASSWTIMSALVVFASSPAIIVACGPPRSTVTSGNWFLIRSHSCIV